jgi:stage III sporulation protein AD
MEEIIKIIGIGLIALVIIIILKQYRPEFVIYVSIIAGVIILILIMDKVSAIIDLLTSLSNKTVINNEFLVLLIKITGIAFLTEFSVSICKDSGETAIANKIDIGGKVLIISMSIPIIASLLETIIKILP